MERDIVAVSNELEFNLHDILSETVQDNTDLDIDQEVNPRDIAELNVSMKDDIESLNRDAADSTEDLIGTVEDYGGTIYGGGSLLRDVSDVEPKWYRTTALSEQLARGLMDITSQQVVLGVNDEGLGIDLYNIYRHLNPVYLSLSVSSPFRYADGGVLQDTGAQSRRMEQYRQMCGNLPDCMWKDTPEINSMEEFHDRIDHISEETKALLSDGELDPNWEELRKDREDGAYYPFDRLAPHQVFLNVRFRPDHRNVDDGGDSEFSIEVRSPDMPLTTERMQMINSLVVGPAYVAADQGTGALPADLMEPLDASYSQLVEASRHGLEADLGGRSAESLTYDLAEVAAEGLEGRGFENEARTMERRLDEVVEYGTDADLIRREVLDRHFDSADELRRYLADQLKSGYT